MTSAGLHGFAGTERYELLDELGSGGMGTVYRAFDHEARTHVALKVLESYRPEALVWFKREFRSLADIQHRNLIMLGELCESEGHWFFTMELI
ncbi:MAG: protein kinase, partial [Myxococcota bacterium]